MNERIVNFRGSEEDGEEPQERIDRRLATLEVESILHRTRPCKKRKSLATQLRVTYLPKAILKGGRVAQLQVDSTLAGGLPRI